MVKKRTIIKQFRTYMHSVIKCIYDTNNTKRGRPDKFSLWDKFNLWYYIKYILRVLFYGITWDSLDCNCDPSTIRKKFYKWRELNVFYICHKLLLDHYSEITDISHLYIDSTVIANQNCNEHISYTYKLKGKKAIKLNTLVTNDEITVAHIICKPSIHDSKITIPLIEQIDENIHATYHSPVYICSDKAYTNNDTKNFLKKQHKYLIYEDKKNTKKEKKNKNRKHLKKLDKRYKVEVSYMRIKRRYRRISLPVDKRVKNYNSFCLLAFSCDLLMFLTSIRKIKKCTDKLKEKINNMYNNLEYNLDNYVYK